MEKKTKLKSKTLQPVKKPRTKPIKKFAKKPSIEVINKSLIDHYGIITQVCRDLDATSATVYKWIKSSTKLQETLSKSRERFIDEAEFQLMKNIKAGKETSIIFTLKCLAKQRGYVDKQEVEINHNVRQIIINVSDVETRNLLENFNLNLIEKKNPPLDEYNNGIQ